RRAARRFDAYCGSVQPRRRCNMTTSPQDNNPVTRETVCALLDTLETIHQQLGRPDVWEVWTDLMHHDSLQRMVAQSAYRLLATRGDGARLILQAYQRRPIDALFSFQRESYAATDISRRRPLAWVQDWIAHFTRPGSAIRNVAGAIIAMDRRNIDPPLPPD